MMQKNNKNKFFVDPVLPWDNLPGDRLRKNSILVLLILLCLLAILIIQRTPVPEKNRQQKQEVPERLAKLVMERKKREEPPPPPPEPEKKEEKKKEEKKEEKPEEKKEEKPEPKEQEVKKAREKAKKELAVFDDQLSGLRDLAPTAPSPNNLRRGGNETTQIKRNLITSRAGTGSGGIAVSRQSSGGGGGGNLSGGQVAQVESDITKSGGSGAETRRTKQGTSQRTDEQIRRIFDRYAGRINSIYVRALRQNPALQGTVVLDLVIAPSGEVTDVKVKSSELNDPELEQKLLLIVKMMDFGKLPVEIWKGEYPVNFFPR